MSANPYTGKWITEKLDEWQSKQIGREAERFLQFHRAFEEGYGPFNSTEVEILISIVKQYHDNYRLSFSQWAWIGDLRKKRQEFRANLKKTDPEVLILADRASASGKILMSKAKDR